MELATVVTSLRRQWVLFISPIFIVAVPTLLAIPAMVNPQPSYSISMHFSAASPADVAIDDVNSYEDTAYIPWVASEFVVLNLPRWITGDTFTREVSEQLATSAYPIAYDDLHGAFNADSAWSILVMYIAWNDETELRAIAEAAVTVLQTRNAAYFPQFAAYPAQIIPLDEPELDVLSPSVVDRFAPLVRLGIAVGLAGALAVTVDAFDRRIHSAQDLASLDTPFLGGIPRH